MRPSHDLEPQRAASAPGRAPARGAGEREHPLLALQRLYGNRRVARARAGAAGASLAPPDVEAGIDAARGAGQPLDAGLRAHLQPFYGHDLGDVRLHTDARADSLSRAIDARAFTVGSDVFFRSGEYAPSTSEGRGLLGHELTHVGQQDGAGVGRRLEIGAPDDEFEREAQTVARDVVRAERERTVQRQPVAGEEEAPEREEEPA